MDNTLVSSRGDNTKCNSFIIMDNVRSRDKMDELTALVRHNRELHKCSLVCFMETTKLYEHIPESAVDIACLPCVLADKTYSVTLYIRDI